MASYEEIKDLPNHPLKLLVDVRNVDEVEQKGQIPTSVVISIPQLEEALKLPEDEFKSRYNRQKPSKDSVVIFHCNMGGRAQKATDLAKSIGFTNAKCYKGSWTEWNQRENMK